MSALYWMSGGHGPRKGVIEHATPAEHTEAYGGYWPFLILRFVFNLALILAAVIARPFEALLRYGFSWRYAAPWGWFTPFVTGLAMLTVLHVLLTHQYGLSGAVPGVHLLTVNFHLASVGVWIFMGVVLTAQVVQMALAYRRRPDDDGIMVIYSGTSYLYRLSGMRNAYPHSKLNHLIQLIAEPALVLGAYWFCFTPEFAAIAAPVGFIADPYSLTLMLMGGCGMVFVKYTQMRFFLLPNAVDMWRTKRAKQREIKRSPHFKAEKRRNRVHRVR